MATSAPRDRKKTHNKIRMAIVRLEQGRPSVVESGRKISIAAVAKEAGVSRTLISNLYPEFLDRIMGNANKHTQKQRDKKQEALKEERQKNRKLRKVIEELKQQQRLLVSKNATLELENRRLTRIIESENVTLFQGKNN